MAFIIAMVGALVATVAGNTPIVGVEQQVRRADDIFWRAFNTCDRAQMAEMFTPDVEFYHDKTGATFARDAVVKSLMDGPCGTAGLHVRREAVANSVSFDPVPGFGAILTGRHRFYARRDGQAERLDGEARFAIVWQIANGRPLIRRVLSFAHGPTLDGTEAGPIDVPKVTLQSYVGRYATPMGEVIVTVENDRLHLMSGGLTADLVAMTSTIFRAPQRPLQFEFMPQAGRAIKIRVRENGSLVAEGIRIDASPARR